MGYILGQYNKAMNADDGIFMTQITTNCEPKRKVISTDIGVTGESLNPFQNECIYISEGLQNSKSYYFHGRIKRLVSNQIFYIKLINFNDAPGTQVEQYIKTITVQGGNTSEWVDVEFIFKPLIAFDSILFELQRTVEDYRTETRYPVIIYEELSTINNIIKEKIATDISLIKIGVQSRPGLMMCINGEEIHTSRSGVYEIKNGVILVSFFSVVTSATELEVNLRGLEYTLSALSDSLTEAEKKATIMSKCIFSNLKARKIDAFTLDYMYEEEA